MVGSKQFILKLLEKWFLTPFRNKVSKTLLYVGAGIVATPLIEHLIVNLFIKKFFGVDLGITVPDTKAYIAGVTLMVSGGLHNVAIEYFHHKTASQEMLLRFKEQTADENSNQYIGSGDVSNSLKNIMNFIYNDIWPSLYKLPDLYMIKEEREEDIELYNKLLAGFEKCEAVYFSNRAFYDKEISNLLNEILLAMKNEISFLHGLLDRREKQDFKNFNGLTARGESKSAICEILQKIQQLEEVIRTKYSET